MIWIVVSVLAGAIVGHLLWNAITYLAFLRKDDGVVKSHRRPYGEPDDEGE